MVEALDMMFPFVMFSFGLVFGSFANVLIWRIPRGESISSPGSHCPACDHAVRWYDNIPVVSWLVLRGRCRDCSTPISVRYPLIELATALLWLACALRFDFGPRALVAAVMCYLLLVLSAIDLDVLRLPNVLVAVLGSAGVIAVTLAQTTDIVAAPLTPVGGVFTAPALAALAGSVLGGGVSLLIALAYRGVRGRSGFGMGDVKLLIALGPYLGIYNVGVLFVGSIIGAVWGVVAAARSRQGMAAKIPFGPSLAVAAVILGFFGPAMWAWYAGIVGLA